jgi:hypothetical protein
MAGYISEAARTPRSDIVNRAQGRQGKVSVGLLPAEPAIRGKPGGKDRSAWINTLNLGGDTDEGFSFEGESALDRATQVCK